MRLPDRALRRWLRSGRPRRVERRLGDPSVHNRLEEMTALGPSAREALDSLTAADADVIERVTEAVEERVDGGELAALIDLVGLGWHTAAAVVADDRHDSNGPAPTVSGDEE